MIQEKNTQNLQWFVDQDHQMEGYWFALDPTLSVWNNTIEKIQNFVGEELSKEKITNWAPYPYKLGHISVFVGLNAKATGEEKAAILRRIAEKISQTQAYSINFENAVIKRGPGKYVTLHLDSPATKAINELVREAIAESYYAHEFDISHLTGELNKDISPHITLGIIDVEDSIEILWPNKHKDIKALVNNDNTMKFQKLFKQKFKSTASFPINSIELMGTNNLSKKSKIAEKNYLTLASCGLMQAASKNSPQLELWYDPTWGKENWYPIIKARQIPRVTETMAVLTVSLAKVFNKADLKLAFEKDVCENGHQLISMGFEDLSDAKSLVQLIDPSCPIFEKENRFWVSLGENRMSALCEYTTTHCKDIVSRIYKYSGPKVHATLWNELFHLQLIKDVENAYPNLARFGLNQPKPTEYVDFWEKDTFLNDLNPRCPIMSETLVTRKNNGCSIAEAVIATRIRQILGKDTVCRFCSHQSDKSISIRFDDALDASTIHNATNVGRLNENLLIIKAEDLPTLFEKGIYRELGSYIYNECYKNLHYLFTENRSKMTKYKGDVAAKSIQSWKSVQ